MNEKVVEAVKSFLLPELKELRSAIERLEFKMDTEIQGLKSEFQGLSHKVDGLSHKVDGLNSQNEAIKYLLDELRFQKKNGRK